MQKLLLLPTVKQIKCDFLLSEGKYLELFDEVKRIGGLAAFCRYENILKECYPAEVLLWYAERLSEEMDAASSRSKYLTIVSHFKRLMDYPNGQEQVLLLSEQWRAKYPKRKAMLEEIANELTRCKIKRQ